MHLLPIRAGKGFVEPALTPQTLPELTADGAPESSLFFIRLPGSGKGKARGGMEGGVEERWSSQGLPHPPMQTSYHCEIPEPQRWGARRRASLGRAPEQFK